MRDFRSIKAWHKAHQLTLDIYKMTEAFPDSERYGLISQMRRASASIPTNIAEGCGRQSNAELVRFMHISTGSASELEYQLLLAKDLEFLNPAQHSQLTTKTIEIKKMISSFIKTIR